MRRAISNQGTAVLALLLLVASGVAAKPNDKEDLLKVREAVWRAWFANDTAALKKLVPEDTLVISSGEEKWHNQAEVFQSSAEFHQAGGKLIRLEFPRTEIQRFGDVAITYSLYRYETEVGGKRAVSSGRVTEVFVLRQGTWTNPGWHADSGK
jgi:ketosteroid isomerase-like protein